LGSHDIVVEWDSEYEKTDGGDYSSEWLDAVIIGTTDLLPLLDKTTRSNILETVKEY